MKTNSTDSQRARIIAALAKLHVRPFSQESSDPKYDAQRNLSGKTHYVDDDTLKFHKSRALSSARLEDGLLLRIATSDALDMRNTKRGFRAVVFDVFGTVIDRPTLEQASSTKEAALNRSRNQPLDLVAYYQEALESQLRRKQCEAAELAEAIETISGALV